MTSTEIITIILTSAVISTVISFLLRYFFESKQKHRFEMEREQLNVELQHRFEMELKKLNGYPLLVKSVSRTRTKAREICNKTREIDSADYESTLALKREFRSRFEKLDNCLYTLQIWLERDGIYGKIHNYKNLIDHFDDILDDYLKYLHSQDAEQEKIEETVQKLQGLYSDIDKAYKPITKELYGALTALKDVNGAGDILDSNKSHKRT